MNVHKKGFLVSILLLATVLTAPEIWALTNTGFGPCGLKTRPESLTTGVVTLQNIVAIAAPAPNLPAGATVYQAHVDAVLNLGNGAPLTLNSTTYIAVHGNRHNFVPENRPLALHDQLFVVINNNNGLLYALSYGATHVVPGGAGDWISVENNDSFWLYGQKIEANCRGVEDGGTETSVKPTEGADLPEASESITSVEGN